MAASFPQVELQSILQKNFFDCAWKFLMQKFCYPKESTKKIPKTKNNFGAESRIPKGLKMFANFFNRFDGKLSTILIS